MTATPVPNPPLGEEVFPGQDLGIQAETHPDGGFTVCVVDEHTRLIHDFISPVSGHGMPGEEYGRNAEPGEKMLYWGYASQQVNPRRGEYLPYPPVSGPRPPTSALPVNQFAVGHKWRDILSRFAHDVMAFNPSSNHLRDAGTHTSGHLPPTDPASLLKNKATYQLGRAVSGVAFHRIEQWLALDAQRLAQYPAAVPDDENWKIWQDGLIPVAEDEIPIPNMGDMMAYICGDEVKEIAGLCVGAWVYLLNERIDASSFDSNMNSGGEIRLPDPAFHPWRPTRYLHRVTGTRSERADQWGEIMGWFRDAHDHYLASVAPAVDHA